LALQKRKPAKITFKIYKTSNYGY